MFCLFWRPCLCDPFLLLRVIVFFLNYPRSHEMLHLRLLSQKTWIKRSLELWFIQFKLRCLNVILVDEFLKLRILYLGFIHALCVNLCKEFFNLVAFINFCYQCISSLNQFINLIISFFIFAHLSELIDQHDLSCIHQSFIFW
jgi:hypothetical protein